ncbi:hypothetical protein GCM10018785_26990 [Streptomyces longispororuber]|uniref:PRL2-23 n=1 Tax=Streptomyces longispororuber TaxID=68230 RepID=A0A919DL60_9ACTN|nr:hypothetical protein [Streptomyces longispororuber]GHE56298.1 hypothetical protein GCM10018785_26990 [Streptomyces longispororuber]
MLPTLATAALTIVATLLGAILSGRAQERAAERQVRVTHTETIRRDRLKAITELACAASDHRTMLWRRGDAVLKNADPERIEALRGESHVTRNAVTHPLTALRVLIQDPAVRTTADRMITLTYAIRQAIPTAPIGADPNAAKQRLTEAREAAKVAHDDFVDTAARYLNPAMPTATPHPTPEEPTR